jgi:hypothetical protein
MPKTQISPIEPDNAPSVGGRKAWGLRVRERIDSSRIVDRLQAHIHGECDMSQTQINAARILLNRTLPEIKAIEVKPDGDRNAKNISNDDLFALVIEGTAERVG